MYTEFGKILKKLRIDNNEFAKDMAKKLGITQSLLSAVDRGKRNPQLKWLDVIVSNYDIDKKDLFEAYEKSIFTKEFLERQKYKNENIKGEIIDGN